MTGRARRWPVHPPPHPGEALTSWLDRLAAVYDLTAEQLLRHNLGPASNLLAEPEADDLDFDPPAAILEALAERTGVELGELRSMTIAGWVPWLADTLEPYDGQEHFDAYVRGDSVLLAPREAGSNTVTHWLPWVPAHHRQWRTMWRLCPVCAAAPDSGIPLLAALPIMISCGEHGCRLEYEVQVHLAVIEEPVLGRAVNAAVAALDRLTHQALTTGAVTLPGRPDHPVHVGVWLRLLRTLLDEVSTSTSRVGAASTAALEKIWDVAGWPIRAGLTVWKPYERLDATRQEAMLTAAATTLHLAQAGEITLRGTLAHLLVPPEDQPVYDGDRPPPPPAPHKDAWRELMEHLEEALTQARVDPAAARQLLAILTLGCRTQRRFEQERSFLFGLGVPGDFLPSAREFGRDDVA